MKRTIAYIYLFVVFFLLIGSGLSVEAATADDLRELIGEKRLTDESRREDIYRVLYRHQQIERQNELVGLLDLSIEEYEKQLEELSSEKAEKETSFLEAFREGEDGVKVLSRLREVYAAADKMGELPHSASYVLDLIEDDEAMISYFESLKESMGDNFDLGQIGEGLYSPLMGPLEVVSCFGRYKEVTDKVRLLQNDGVVLAMPYEDSVRAVSQGAVASQFNGKVESVTKVGEEEGTEYYEIVLSHGKSVVTTYSPVKDVLVKAGEEVQQYQVLGMLEGEELYFEVDLNGIPINPLFLYGGNGERAYDAFYAANPGIFLSREDFSHVKKEVANTGTVAAQSNSSVVIDEDGTETPLVIEGQTEKPETPVAEYTPGY